MILTMIQRERQRKYVEKGKKIIDEYRESTPCLFCGCKSKELEFHHIDPRKGDKTRAIGQFRGSGRTKAFFKEVEECWPLCRDCHSKLHLRLCDPLPSCYT